MDSLDHNDLKDFVANLVKRGLGLYGQTEMAKICYKSGIALTDLNEIEWLEADPAASVNHLLINYGAQNLPAKMTAIVLARKYNIPVPKELTKKKQNTSRRYISRLFKRKKN